MGSHSRAETGIAGFNLSVTLASLNKINMRCLTVIAVCVVVALGANTLESIINAEVKSIIATDSALSVDHCRTKCDALFDLVAGGDERISDRMCKFECTCQITGNCTTRAPHAHGHQSSTAMPTVATIAP